MSQTVAYKELAAMLRGAIAQIREHHATLSELDSVGGDGDHGTTMVRAMANMEKAIGDSASGQLKDLLFDVGWAIMGVDGGATGPLFGSLFMGMSEAVEGKDTLDAPTVAAMFEAGLAAIEAQTKARVGDKTLMDALTPAVAALRAAADAGQDIPACLRSAADAAAQGAIATKDLPTRFGRAKNIGERTIGYQDPGATSMSFIFRGFAGGVEDVKRET